MLSMQLLAMLESASQVPETTTFISEALAQTYSIFSSMDCVVKSNVEIIPKLNALKEKNMEFDHSLLSKKQVTHRLSKLVTKYDAHKERIRVLTEELERDKAKLASFVEQGKTIKAQRL